MLKLFFFPEKVDWSGVNGASVLQLGHHREGLLRLAVHRPLQRPSLARRFKNSQETS
jgi:hypothetical protein